MAIISMTIASASASLTAALALLFNFCIFVMANIGPHPLPPFNTRYGPPSTTRLN
jgi:hypothetical protein